MVRFDFKDLSLSTFGFNVCANQKSGRSRMKDFQTHLENLRREAAECARIRDLTTDKVKWEMFDRMALHLSSLADQVEEAMLHWRPGKSSTK